MFWPVVNVDFDVSLKTALELCSLCLASTCRSLR